LDPPAIPVGVTGSDDKRPRLLIEQRGIDFREGTVAETLRMQMTENEDAFLNV